MKKWYFIVVLFYIPLIFNEVEYFSYVQWTFGFPFGN